MVYRIPMDPNLTTRRCNALCVIHVNRAPKNLNFISDKQVIKRWVMSRRKSLSIKRIPTNLNFMCDKPRDMALKRYRLSGVGPLREEKH